MGLKPVLRRVWAPRGRRPVATRHAGATSGLTSTASSDRRPGRSFLWLVMPTVNAQAFSLALSRLGEWVGVSEDKRVVLVLDRAGWHVAKDLKVPEGLHLAGVPAGALARVAAGREAVAPG